MQPHLMGHVQAQPQSVDGQFYSRRAVFDERPFDAHGKDWMADDSAAVLEVEELGSGVADRRGVGAEPPVVDHVLDRSNEAGGVRGEHADDAILGDHRGGTPLSADPRGG